ncbi:unnamed protein product [Mycena citricolor]|uniref:Uncharacterized protein n=1 Tax=Mycena citricolor TaxID=2018698 RepID=A0AAD2JYR5_9AGAR|nr:unnamed protein product [Mycena citricolor]
MATPNVSVPSPSTAVPKVPHGMTYFSNIEESGPQINSSGAAFDITNTILATLSAASQLSPVPFVQQAAGLALTISKTVQGVRDNKEAFKALANDACDLVSAIVLVYEDLAKSGVQPSSALGKRVEDLIVTLGQINASAEKSASRSLIRRVFTVTSQAAQIVQFRARLKQSLDVFGLQSSISIHENVVQVLSELRVQQQKLDSESASQAKSESESTQSQIPPHMSTPAPSAAGSGSVPPTAHPTWANVFEGNTLGGNITITNISGDHTTRSNFQSTHISNSFNGRRPYQYY